MSTTNQPTLSQTVGQTIILAYRENTDRLNQALTHEQLTVQILRQTDRPEYSEYASIYRCMLNHAQAWQQASQSDRPTLIVEADFVPTKGMGQRPFPFNPQQTHAGIAWLYACAPQLYHVTPEGFAEGFSTSLVAYIITPTAAQALYDFVAYITNKHGTGYYNFDSEIEEFLRLKGFKNYIPWRNYGEHGGKSNPEHRQNGMPGIHRADTLYGQLAFLPDYITRQSNTQFSLLKARIKARLYGLGRLLTGRYLRHKILRTSKVPLRLIRFAILRQFTWH
jgi:hypothetical protein